MLVVNVMTITFLFEKTSFITDNIESDNGEMHQTDISLH